VSAQSPHSFRLLLLITKSELGGAQSHVRDLAEALLHLKGHSFAFDIHLAAGGSLDQPLFKAAQALGLHCHLVPELTNTLNPFRVSRSVNALADLIQTIRPHLIHAHSSTAGAIARYIGSMINIPVVYTVHGFGFKAQVPWLQRHIAWVIEKMLAPRTAAMICVSRAEKGLAEQLPSLENRIHVIHNGIPDHPSRAKPQHHADVIMVARCAAPKRHDLLAQAWLMLNPSAHLTLAGGGASVETWRKTYVAPNITWSGDVQNIPDLLKVHGIFVLISDHEGLPISILEAMRAGMAIIASDLPGIREQIEHGKHGLLVDNTPQAIADALAVLQAQPQRRAALGRAARQRYEIEFGATRMAQATLNIYAQARAIQHTVFKSRES
jgi:glycosyltransferase involved in cell wall biosynthesis